MMKRLLSMIGLAEDPEDRLDTVLPPEEIREREERLRRPMPSGAGVLICRGPEAIGRRKELLEALRGGRVVIIDLRGVEREAGQALLDYLSGVVEAGRGLLMRLAPAVFLVVSHESLVEVWER